MRLGFQQYEFQTFYLCYINKKKKTKSNKQKKILSAGASYIDSKKKGEGWSKMRLYKRKD